MVRLFSGGLGFMALLTLFVAPAKAQTQSGSTPLCVYDSKDYSGGAVICVQKSMMLSCQDDGGKATWKIVTDKDLNDRCIAPVARANLSDSRIRHRRYSARRQIMPVTDPNAKCFNFNGKRYCE